MAGELWREREALEADTAGCEEAVSSMQASIRLPIELRGRIPSFDWVFYTLNLTRRSLVDDNNSTSEPSLTAFPTHDRSSQQPAEARLKPVLSRTGKEARTRSLTLLWYIALS